MSNSFIGNHAAPVTGQSIMASLRSLRDEMNDHCIATRAVSNDLFGPMPESGAKTPMQQETCMQDLVQELRELSNTLQGNVQRIMNLR